MKKQSWTTGLVYFAIEDRMVNVIHVKSLDIKRALEYAIAVRDVAARQVSTKCESVLGCGER